MAATERRFHERIRVDLPVVYTYSNKKRTITDKSTTFDFSDSGMSFFTNKSFHKGNTLKINLPHIWDSSRNCTVRWCSSKNPNLYKVGIFIQ
jgi:c-di-GMP-binding flagellar brake protein YcgR